MFRSISIQLILGVLLTDGERWEQIVGEVSIMTWLLATWLTIVATHLLVLRIVSLIAVVAAGLAALLVSVVDVKWAGREALTVTGSVSGSL